MGSSIEPELFERDSDLAELAEALLRAREGSGAVVAIEGPAGIGKTRLLRAARKSATEAAMHVLHARGAELEREFPYGLARQLFEQALAEAQDGERRALISGAAKTKRPRPVLIAASRPPSCSPCRRRRHCW